MFDNRRYVSCAIRQLESLGPVSRYLGETDENIIGELRALGPGRDNNGIQCYIAVRVSLFQPTTDELQPLYAGRRAFSTIRSNITTLIIDHPLSLVPYKHH